LAWKVRRIRIENPGRPQPERKTGGLVTSVPSHRDGAEPVTRQITGAHLPKRWRNATRHLRFIEEPAATRGIDMAKYDPTRKPVAADDATPKMDLPSARWT